MNAAAPRDAFSWILMLGYVCLSMIRGVDSDLAATNQAKELIMNRNTHLSMLIIAAGLATAGGLAYASQAGSGTNDAVADLAKAQITLEQAVGTALGQHPGAKATKAELDSEKGATFYEVEVATADHQVFDVKIDAGSGKVLSSQLDKHDGGNDKEDE